MSYDPCNTLQLIFLHWSEGRSLCSNDSYCTKQKWALKAFSNTTVCLGSSKCVSRKTNIGGNSESWHCQNTKCINSFLVWELNVLLNNGKAEAPGGAGVWNMPWSTTTPQCHQDLGAWLLEFPLESLFLCPEEGNHRSQGGGFVLFPMTFSNVIFAGDLLTLRLSWCNRAIMKPACKMNIQF